MDESNKDLKNSCFCKIEVIPRIFFKKLEKSKPHPPNFLN